MSLRSIVGIVYCPNACCGVKCSANNPATSFTSIAFFPLVPFLAGVTFVALFTLDISQGLYIAIAQGDHQNAIGGHSDIADANAVGSLCAVLAHDHAKIGCVSIRIGQHQMALCIDFRFLDTVAIGTFDIAQIDSSIVIQSYFQVAELSYGDCFDAYTGSSDVALVTLVAFFALHGAQIDALAVGERQHQLVFGIDLRSGDAHAILTGGTGVTFLALFTLDALFTLGAGGTGITLFTLDTLHTLCADVTLVALFTFITLGADHSAQCIRASIAVGNHQLAVRIDDSGGHAHAVLTGGTGVAFVTFFTPDTLSTLCTGVAFVAFLTLGTLHSTEVFDLSVGIGQHQLAGCIDVGCGDAISGLTLFTGSTGVALVTFLAPDVAQLQLCTTGESDGQVAGSNVDILDADTVLAVLTGGTGITLFTLFTFLTLGADYGAEVFDGVVGISKYKLTTIIQLAFQNAKAVLSGSAGITLFAPDTLSALCTGVAFVTLVTFFTLHTGGTHDRATFARWLLEKISTSSP